MNIKTSGLFNFADKLQMASLSQRTARNEVITSNIANSETPGYRALGLSFEDQLQAASRSNEPLAMKTSSGKHMLNHFTEADGTMHPDVFVQPTESIPNDGNTVDVDREMSLLAENQILYRATIELLNRKLGTIRYAITAGGR